jgi:hypothetical protein
MNKSIKEVIFGKKYDYWRKYIPFKHVPTHLGVKAKGIICEGMITEALTTYNIVIPTRTG